MRQINFLIVFALCLAVVLFGLQNTQPTVVQIVDGVEIQAPLSIELILAMGLGALLAWLFSIWTKLQQWLGTRKAFREIRSKEERIEQLEQDVEQYKTEIDEQQLPALSASKPKSVTEKAMAE